MTLLDLLQEGEEHYYGASVPGMSDGEIIHFGTFIFLASSLQVAESEALDALGPMASVLEAFPKRAHIPASLLEQVGQAFGTYLLNFMFSAMKGEWETTTPMGYRWRMAEASFDVFGAPWDEFISAALQITLDSVEAVSLLNTRADLKNYYRNFRAQLERCFDIIEENFPAHILRYFKPEFLDAIVHEVSEWIFWIVEGADPGERKQIVTQLTDIISVIEQEFTSNLVKVTNL